MGEKGVNVYKNKPVILATKHKKEEAVRPSFEAELGCTIHVPDHYDTDQFGTFTGEIPRLLSPYETLVEKAKRAAQQFGYCYAIASEGCFGPHPQYYFAASDTELMAFIDLERDLIIAEMEISMDTNYAHVDITAHDNYDDFLDKAKFPTHGIIVRALQDEKNYLIKGIVEHKQLKIALEEAFKCSETVRLETDMRAMMNPLRMQVINQLAIKLVKRIQQCCPQCNVPGFGKISTEGNLACSACGTLTKRYQRKVLSCLKCDYKIHQPREDGLELSEPKDCPYCNP